MMRCKLIKKLANQQIFRPLFYHYLFFTLQMYTTHVSDLDKAGYARLCRLRALKAQ